MQQWKIINMYFSHLFLFSREIYGWKTKMHKNTWESRLWIWSYIDIHLTANRPRARKVETPTLLRFQMTVPHSSNST